MAGADRALRAEALGAWLVKLAPRSSTVEALARAGFRGEAAWCVRPSYRTGLVRPGQPVLLWVSGDGALLPAGVHARGLTTGAVVPAGAHGALPALPVRVEPVDPPVLRADLRAHPGLAGLEVLRVPAGSNPSYLDAVQWRALRERWPQVVPPEPPQPCSRR